MTGRHIRRSERPRRRAAIRRAGPAGAADALPQRDQHALDQAALDAAGAELDGGRMSGSVPAAIAPGRATPEVLLALARETYNIRRRRVRPLPADLFGEPTWDILLDLYVATRENRSVPTTSACIGAHVPPTTALRWLRILETRGLVEREDDGRDGRRTFVRLSESGLAAMDDWLRTALASFEHTVGKIIRLGAGPNGPLAEAAE